MKGQNQGEGCLPSWIACILCGIIMFEMRDHSYVYVSYVYIKKHEFHRGLISGSKQGNQDVDFMRSKKNYMRHN